MKDGRTHLAHKAEHAVDVETGAVVGITVQDASAGDTTTMVETLVTAAQQGEAVLPAGGGVAEVVADKGYHSNETMVALADLGLRSYVSEPDRGRRRWRGQLAVRDAVYANRRRIRRARGRRLLRQRGERLERPNAHLYETGRLRRVYLRGHANIRKRLLVHACGLNLGLLMRRLTGVGTPRSLQGRALVDALRLVLSRLWHLVSPAEALVARRPPHPSRWALPRWNITACRPCYKEALCPRAASPLASKIHHRTMRHGRNVQIQGSSARSAPLTRLPPGDSGERSVCRQQATRSAANLANHPYGRARDAPHTVNRPAVRRPRRLDCGNHFPVGSPEMPHNPALRADHCPDASHKLSP